MYQQQYKCTLLTNLVLTGNSATEGFHKSLDYIPGAKLLGMVASKEYETALTKGWAMDLFHNGAVRFGDAFPLIPHKLVDGKPVQQDTIAYRKPFSWLIPKGAKFKTAPCHLADPVPIYVDTATSRDFREDLMEEKDIKLVNAKSGYFTPDYSIQIEQDFSIKSAYNPTTLRSKEGQMYGYFSLPKGSVWTFTVAADEEKYLSIVEQVLVGNKRIGRSRSAEYGMIQIEKMAILAEKEGLSTTTEIAYLYAASNLCFYDEFGNSQPSPTSQDLQLPEGMEIDWQKSQIRTRAYRTWNQKRQNRNTDRLIIGRGSVFAIRTKGIALTPSIYDRGIGAHLSEGFGKVLLNPWFLADTQAQLAVNLAKFDGFDTTKNPYGKAQDASDDKVLTFVKNKSAARKQRFNIDHQVNIFRKTYEKEFADISASQWGQLRRYAKYMKVAAYKKLIFDEKVGFLYRGRMESTWRKKGRREILEAIVFGHSKRPEIKPVPITSALAFMMKLSAMMAKNNKNEQK